MLFSANRKPRLPNPVIYPYWRALVWSLAALHYQFTVSGLENIPMPPGAGKVREYYPKKYNPFTNVLVDLCSFVLAPNHRSLADIVAVGYLMRPFVLVGKPFFAMIPGLKEFFEINGLVPLIPAGIYYGGHKGLLRRRQVAMVIGEAMSLPSCSFGELTKDEKIALADAWQDEVRKLHDEAKQLIEA